MGGLVAILAWSLLAPDPVRLSGLDQPGEVRTVGEGLRPGCLAERVVAPAVAGGAAIRVAYDFQADPPGLQYVGFSVDLAIERPVAWFIVQVHGDGAGQRIALRLRDPSGETHQWTLGHARHTGWAEMTCRLDGGSPESWGGDGNRRLEYPLTFDSLLVDSAVEPAVGAIVFDEISLRRDDATVPENAVPVDLRAGALLPPAASLLLTLTGDLSGRPQQLTGETADGERFTVDLGPIDWRGRLRWAVETAGLTALHRPWRLRGLAPLAVDELLLVPRRPDPTLLWLRAIDADSPPPPVGGDAVHPDSRLTLETTDRRQGRAAWRLDYTFVERAGLQYLEVPTPVELGEAPAGLRLAVWGDQSGNALRCRLVDASGEYFQYDLGPLEFGGWHEFDVDLTGPDQGHWSGDGNGTPNGALRLVSVLLDSSLKPSAGSILLDDLRVHRLTRPADLLDAVITFDRPGGIYAGARPTACEVALTWRGVAAADAAEPSAELLLRDRHGAILERRPLAVRPDGAPVAVPLPAAAAEPGVYPLEVVLRCGDDTRTAGTTYGVLPEMPATNLPTNPFGACFHYAQGKGRLPLNYQLLAAAGGRWVRDEYGWSTVEPEPGVYRFPEANERYFRAAREQGLEPLMILDYGNPHYDDGNAPASERAQRAFAEYAYQMVARYKDSCRYWEVYNEPNIGFWRPEPDPVAYARLLKLTYAAVKRADPEAVVVGICTAGVDLRYIEAVLKEGAGPFMDALSVHPYRYPASPEESDFVGSLRACHALMEQYGIGDKPLWLTEIGWPNQLDGRGVTEQVTAGYLVRMVSLARSLPFVGPVIWYDFQNDGLNPEYNEDNFGLIRLDYTPKRPYLAAAMMNRVLADKSFERDSSPAEGVFAHLYQAGGRRCLVLWSTPAARRVTLDPHPAGAELSDAAGRIEPLGAGPLTLGEMPLFITGEFEPPTVTVVD